MTLEGHHQMRSFPTWCSVIFVKCFQFYFLSTEGLNSLLIMKLDTCMNNDFCNQKHYRGFEGNGQNGGLV